VPGHAPEPEPNPDLSSRPAIAIASGKGGVGKSVLAVNLATAMNSLRRQVLLVDAELGLASAHHLLGLPARRSLRDVLRGDCDLVESLCETESGFLVLPAGDGDEELANLDELSRQRLIRSLSAAETIADLVILDAPAGIGREATQLATAVEHLIVVTTPERTALAGAYALLQVIARRRSLPAVSLLLNQVYEARELELGERLVEAASSRLGFKPEILGWVPSDPAVRRSVEAQIPFVTGEPYAAATRAVRAIARKLVGDPRLRPLIRQPVPAGELIEIRRAS
jgi:flagellar biosynthesis protein FlhG